MIDFCQGCYKRKAILSTAVDVRIVKTENFENQVSIRKNLCRKCRSKYLI
jgi:hypothetical protein